MGFRPLSEEEIQSFAQPQAPEPKPDQSGGNGGGSFRPLGADEIESLSQPQPELTTTANATGTFRPVNPDEVPAGRIPFVASDYHLSQLDPDTRIRWDALARDYYEATGEPLKMRSGFRSTEHQAKLYAKDPSSGYVAPPGNSTHEQGMAIDLDKSQVPRLEKLGLIDKYFNRPLMGQTKSGIKEPWHIEHPGARQDPIFNTRGRQEAEPVDLYDKAIAYAEEYGVRPDVYLSLIKQESGFNPKAKSPTGVRGISQMTLGTGKAYGINNEADRSDPDKMLRAGAAHLADLLREKGNIPDAVYAYNGGSDPNFQANVGRHLGWARKTIADRMQQRQAEAEAQWQPMGTFRPLEAAPAPTAPVPEPPGLLARAGKDLIQPQGISSAEEAAALGATGEGVAKVLGTINPLIDAGGKVLGSLGTGAQFVHGRTEPITPEEQEAADMVGREFIRGSLSGATVGLYQPPMPTEEEQKLGAGIVRGAGQFSGAILPISKIAGVAAMGGAGPVTVAGATGFIWDLMDRWGTKAGKEMAGQEQGPTPESMLSQGIQYVVKKSPRMEKYYEDKFDGKPAIKPLPEKYAQIVAEHLNKYGPVGTSIDFMLGALGIIGTAKAIQGATNMVNNIRWRMNPLYGKTAEEASAWAKEKGAASVSKPEEINMNPQGIEEALASTEQLRMAKRSDELNKLIKSKDNPYWRQARLYDELAKGYADKSHEELIAMLRERMEQTAKKAPTRKTKQEPEEAPAPQPPPEPPIAGPTPAVEPVVAAEAVPQEKVAAKEQMIPLADGSQVSPAWAKANPELESKGSVGIKVGDTVIIGGDDPMRGQVKKIVGEKVLGTTPVWEIEAPADALVTEKYILKHNIAGKVKTAHQAPVTPVAEPAQEVAVTPAPEAKGAQAETERFKQAVPTIITGFRTEGLKGRFFQRGHGTYIALDSPFQPDQGIVRQVSVEIDPQKIFDPDGLIEGSDVEESKIAFEGLINTLNNEAYNRRLTKQAGRKAPEPDLKQIAKDRTRILKAYGFEAEAGWIDGPEGQNRELVVFDKSKVIFTEKPSRLTPRVYRDENNWWRVEGSDVKHSSEKAAQKAAAVIGRAKGSAGPTKQPWEMTKKEYLAPYNQKKGNDFFPSNTRLGKMEGNRIRSEQAASRKASEDYHRKQVAQALESGRPVPPEVLADYPDLSAKYAEPTPTQTLPAPENVQQGASGEAGAEVQAPVDPLDTLIAQYIATGRTATRYPKKKAVSVDGRTMTEKGAEKKMREVLSKETPDLTAAKAFREKFGSRKGKPEGLVTEAPKQTQEEWVAAQKPKKKRVYDIQKAIEEGDIITIVRSHGRFDSQSSVIKDVTISEERKYLLPFVVSRNKNPNAVGVDDYFDEIKDSYPGMFDQFESSAEFVRFLVDKSAKRELKFKSFEEEIVDHDAEIEERSVRDAVPPDDLTEAERIAEAEVIAAERAGRIESLGDELDTSWEFDEAGNLIPEKKPEATLTEPSTPKSRLTEFRQEYPKTDPKRAEIVLKTFPDASNAEISAIANDPKRFEQLRKQRLQKMSDAGGDADQMQALPGMGGLFEEPAPAKATPLPKTTAKTLTTITEAEQHIKDIEKQIEVAKADLREITQTPEVQALDPRRTYKSGDKVWMMFPSIMGTPSRIEGVVFNSKSGPKVRITTASAGGARTTGLFDYLWAKDGETFKVPKPVQEGKDYIKSLESEKNKIQDSMPDIYTGEIQQKVEASKKAGNVHLDQVEPREGMQVRDISDGEVGTLTHDEEYGWLFNNRTGLVKSHPDWFVVEPAPAKSEGKGEAVKFEPAEIVKEGSAAEKAAFKPTLTSEPETTKQKTKKMYSFPGVSTEDLIKLATPGLEYINNVKQGIQSLMLPTAKSKEHFDAAVVVGSKLGTMNRMAESANKKLQPGYKLFSKAGVYDPDTPLAQNPGSKFASDLSQGRTPAPEFQDLATEIQKGFEHRLKMLEAAGAPLESVRDNYFPGMWQKDSIRAFNQAIEEYIAAGNIIPQNDIFLLGKREREAIKTRVDELIEAGKGSDKDHLQYLTRRPFKGSESFRKAKVFDDFMDAVEFGLRPISNNPIDIVKLKYAEMDRSVMANRAIREFEAKGDIINVNNSGVPLKKNLRANFNPDEWTRVSDRYGEIWRRDPKTKALIKVGYRVAKKPVADILNNYLSSSLYNSPYFGTAYKSYMAVGNFLNQSQLGWGSLFHAGFTTIEAQISANAEAIKDIYGYAKGNRSLSQLGQALKKVPVATVRTGLAGHKILREWQNPAISIPEDVPIQQILVMQPQGGVWSANQQATKVALVAKAIELAGGHATMEKGLRTNQSAKMVEDWAAKKKFKASLRSPIALSEAMMKPVMYWIVPRQKLGVFADMAWRILEQNPGKTMTELRPLFRQAWNRVDARLGQVGYDRLFVNNVAKNVVQGLIRAPGWSGGTIAELGGSIKDASKFFKDWYKSGESPDDIPDRVAYALALFASIFMANGLLTYALTGDRPKGMDWWAFRDGGKDKYGNPTRWLLPSYMKDVYAYWENWSQVLLHKTHPVISVAAELKQGHDYYGDMFRDPSDSYIKQGWDTIKQGAKAYVPFWLRGAKKASEPQGGVLETLRTKPGKLIAPEIGVMPATRLYTATPAMKIIDEYYRRQGQQIRLPKEAAISQTRREILNLAGNKQIGQAETLIQKAKEEGKITERQRKQWRKDIKTPPMESLFRHIPLNIAIQAYKVSTPEEKPEMQRLLRRKYHRSDQDKKRMYRDDYHKALGY